MFVNQEPDLPAWAATEANRVTVLEVISSNAIEKKIFFISAFLLLRKIHE